MDIIAGVRRLFELPPVKTTRYRCLDCDVKLENEESYCPECGGEAQEVSEPVEPRYWEPYY